MQTSLNKIKDLITKYDKIALFHHQMIDGDSLASSYGLALAIKQQFPHKKVVWVGDEPNIKARFSNMTIDYKLIATTIDDSYLAIIGDCAGKERIFAFDEYEKAGAKIAFDHHTNDIDFTTDVFWHEPTWVASSIQATLIAETLGVAFNETIALNLIYGIITDSGRFAYSGADPLPLEVAARLVKFIANKTMFKLYQNMHHKTLQDIKFEAWVYQQLTIADQVGYVAIKAADLTALKMSPGRATRVNLIANIDDEKVWIFFVEYPDFIRVEFRSNGFPVNEIAKHFNGGGHVRASGCKLSSWAQLDEVVKYTRAQVKQTNH